MEKKKGLADTGEGEFILNESGTSVSIDADNENELSQNSSDAEKNTPQKKQGSSGPEEKDITS